MSSTDFKELFENVLSFKQKIWTKNLLPGKRVYNEELEKINGLEYRSWNPYRSKIGAGMEKGLNNFSVGKKTKILYLGCAEGTTCSHLSDMVGLGGLIVGVDISGKALQKFIALAELRTNLIPMMADANQPELYVEELKELKFDILIQDVSQKNQAEIFVKNAELFLEKGKMGYLVIKARSIQSHQDPKEVLKKELKVLENKFEILQVLNLFPFEKDHVLIVCEKK